MEPQKVEVQRRRRHSSGEENLVKSITSQVKRSSWASGDTWEERMQIYKPKLAKNCLYDKMIENSHSPETIVNQEAPHLINQKFADLKLDTSKADEADVDGCVRFGGLLCHQENSFSHKRKKTMLKQIQTLMENDNQYSLEEIPNIAVIGSGGGMRAMLAFSSVFNALHDADLLQYILYTAALSGSSWYLTILNSHKDWPNISPRIIQDEIKAKLEKNPFEFFSSTLKMAGHWFYSWLKDTETKSLAEIFGLFLSSHLIPDRFESRWSDVQKKLVNGQAPLPLLSCIHAKEDVSAKEYHEWVELSPYEACMPKYGIAVRMENFGSKFIGGKLENQTEEVPLYLWKGICGSAFTILRDELKKTNKHKSSFTNKSPQISVTQNVTNGFDDVDGFRPDRDEIDGPYKKQQSSNIDDVDGFRPNTDEIDGPYQKQQSSNFDEVDGFMSEDNECLDDDDDEDNSDWNSDWAESLLDSLGSNDSNSADANENEGLDEVDGIMYDTFSVLKSRLKGFLQDTRMMATRAGRAAMLNNPIRKLSFNGRFPDLTPPEGSMFSKIFDKASTSDDRMYFIDAGLAFNLPFPLVLRSQRKVDLILSFDFTDRGEDENDPLKQLRLAEKWAKLHKIRFPPIPKDFNLGVKEMYIFEDERDPQCPVILHMPLVNKDFRKFSKPGVKRTDESSKKYADFDIFSDPEKPYVSTKFTFTKEEANRLCDLVEFNIKNNLHEIKKCMKHCVDKKRRDKPREQNVDK